MLALAMISPGQQSDQPRYKERAHSQEALSTCPPEGQKSHQPKNIALHQKVRHGYYWLSREDNLGHTRRIKPKN